MSDWGWGYTAGFLTTPIISAIIVALLMLNDKIEFKGKNHEKDDPTEHGPFDL